MTKGAYKIEVTEYGLKITMQGLIDTDQINEWFNLLKQEVIRQKSGFNVFVDLRHFAPVNPESQELIQEVQRFGKSQGLQRSIVILNNPITTMQLKRIAQESGIYDWERYIDASTNPDWEKIGLDWIVNELEPEDNKKFIELKEDLV